MKHRQRVKALEDRIQPDRSIAIVTWDAGIPTIRIRGQDEESTPAAVKELEAKHAGPVVHVQKRGFRAL